MLFANSSGKHQQARPPLPYNQGGGYFWTSGYDMVLLCGGELLLFDEVFLPLLAPCQWGGGGRGGGLLCKWTAGTDIPILS
jgi:hypothetical protein